MKPISKHFFLIAILFFVIPLFTFAQSVSLSSQSTTYSTNDTIPVSVKVETGGQPINTIGGAVTFSPSETIVSDVRYGNSIISLWVDKPGATNSGKMTFTGGVPGGFTGNSGLIFTFALNPKKEGTISLGLQDVHVLLNDGSGGELSGVKLIPLTLTITKAKATTPPKAKETMSLPADTTPPESFVPLVSRHPSIENNAYFVSFSAVDKDSGVEKYEVRERPAFISSLTDVLSTDWKPAKSPYVLSMQQWGSKVEVKAIDRAGNSAISGTDKPFSNLILFLMLLILVFIVIILTSFWVRRKNRARKRLQ